MISGPNGTITLDPNRLVAAGDHRYRIADRVVNIGRATVLAQTFTCERCGDTRRPSQPYVPCPAGPVAL